MSMRVPSFKVGDRVRLEPDSGWRGVVIKKHAHRNNGYKVRTIVPHGPQCADEFWLRPLGVEKVTEEG